jgi:two-component system response regulator FlrC
METSTDKKTMCEPIEVLLVEDDAALRDALQVTLELEGVSFRVAANAEVALDTLRRVKPALVISDIRLPGLSGLDLLDKCRALHAEVPVVLMTAYAETKLAVEALRAGAKDFLLKPFKPDQLIDVVRRYAPNVSQAPNHKADLIAVDQSSLQLIQKVERVAKTDTTVLLLGESGSGKEVMARFLHQRSTRSESAFVAINCAAIPSSLLEATLFGHEKGSFTGALKAQSGKFELAQGGTIFLDEIGEMPLELQSKILRVIQERQVERVGSHHTIQLDLRIIAATNQDLAKQVAQGQFREDLYYRINVFPIKIPPLRERPGDVIALADRFVAKYRVSMGFPHAKLSDECKQILTIYHWPGNVRELENTIQRGLLLCDGYEIKPTDIELDLVNNIGIERETQRSNRIPEQVPEQDVNNRATHVVYRDDSAGTHSRIDASDQALAKDSDIRQVEREHIIAVLQKVKGSRKKAVELLGISERTLRYKIKQWKASGIDIP